MDRKKQNNVELKSEKNMNVLGQIPERVTTYSMLTFFIAISFLLLIGFLYKYPYCLKSSISIVSIDNKFDGFIRINSKSSSAIKKGDRVIIRLKDINDVEYTNISTTVDSIFSKIEVASDETYNLIKVSLPDTLNYSKNIKPTSSYFNGNSYIYTKPISLFKRILNSPKFHF